ncbi:iron-molybdenum cofactor processing protein [Rhizobium sp. Pop5]|nr:iron-molybdenum cofactor processing protein [Rhizobium sp. Pop5]
MNQLLATAKSTACAASLCGSSAKPHHVEPAVWEKITDLSCYLEKAHYYFARMHVVAAPACNIQCNYCNSKYCANESRPTPDQALRKVVAVANEVPQLSVLFIAGPSDACYDRKKTKATFARGATEVPDIKLCLSTNGPAVPDRVGEPADKNVDHLTITIKMVDPRAGAKISAPLQGRAAAQQKPGYKQTPRAHRHPSLDIRPTCLALSGAAALSPWSSPRAKSPFALFDASGASRSPLLVSVCSRLQRCGDLLAQPFMLRVVMAPLVPDEHDLVRCRLEGWINNPKRQHRGNLGRNAARDEQYQIRPRSHHRCRENAGKKYGTTILSQVGQVVVDRAEMVGGVRTDGSVTQGREVVDRPFLRQRGMVVAQQTREAVCIETAPKIARQLHVNMPNGQINITLLKPPHGTIKRQTGECVEMRGTLA